MFEFDPTIARSFSYSQGPIWEVIIPEYSSGSVLGGERYDGLFKSLFNLEMSGTGFGLGFDRTLEAADQLGLIPLEVTSTQILVTVFTPELFENSLKTAQSLRSNRINIELFSTPNTRIDKQLKYADKKGIPYVIIIGPEEVKKNVVKLKNMKTGEQKVLKIEEILSVIRSQITPNK